MADKAWKVFERKTARYFGCQDRTPLSGRNSKHTASDTLHEQLFIECKQRKKHAVIKLWREAKELADKEKKIPVVALSEKGKHGFWIMCHSSDLLAVANQRSQAVRNEIVLINDKMIEKSKKGK